MFHWPGASILMVLGAFLLIAVFLPLFTWRRIQLEGKITGQFVFTITISMFFILFTSLIALNVSRNVLDSFVVQANNKTYINDYLRNRNEALLNSIESKKDTLELHSNAVSIKSATDDLNDFINNIQTSLIMRVEGVDKANAVQLMNTVERIMAKDNMDASYLELIGEGNNGKAYELKQKIEQYRLMLVSYAGEADSKRIGSLLDTSFDGIPDGYKTWEESKFSGSALINTLCILKGLQSDINMAESIALNSLLSKSNNL
jgi:hypothetical protein